MTEIGCSVCHGQDIEIIADAGTVPVFCNQLCRTRADAIGAAKAGISLGFCRRCGHLFNTAFDPALIQYSPEYENSLHFSPHFQRYADALVGELRRRYRLKGKRIVEIGCGRGDFLAALCSGGANQGFGFDMSYPEDEPPPTRSVAIDQQPYSQRHAELSADFLCMRHVLEHVAEPVAFLKRIRATLRPGTPVYIEVPNCLFTLRDEGIWDLIYEHCSYFSPESLHNALRLAGFRVSELQETFDGQFLAVHATADTAAKTLESPTQELKDCVAQFGAKHGLKLRLWRSSVEELALAERRVVAWGAGSKGSTFANLVADGERLPYVVDVNPRKHGMFVAGTGARIVPPEFLTEYRPDVVVVLNPNYVEEIRCRLAELGLAPELRVA